MEAVEELFSKPWLERTNVLYYLRCACFVELLSRREGYEELDDMNGLALENSSASKENVEMEKKKKT